MKESENTVISRRYFYRTHTYSLRRAALLAKMACRKYSYFLTGVLLATGATTSAASHVREGKDIAYHDGNLRYRAAQPYAEGSCGFPQVHTPLI